MWSVDTLGLILSLPVFIFSIIVIYFATPFSYGDRYQLFTRAKWVNYNPARASLSDKYHTTNSRISICFSIRWAYQDTDLTVFCQPWFLTMSNSPLSRVNLVVHHFLLRVGQPYDHSCQYPWSLSKMFRYFGKDWHLFQCIISYKHKCISNAKSPNNILHVYFTTLL